MKTIQDRRILRISQVRIIDGEPKSGAAGDARQDDDGIVVVSGLWGGVVPLSPEDMKIRASRLGMSPLEWFRQRLLLSPTVEVEVVG